MPAIGALGLFSLQLPQSLEFISLGDQNQSLVMIILARKIALVNSLGVRR